MTTFLPHPHPGRCHGARPRSRNGRIEPLLPPVRRTPDPKRGASDGLEMPEPSKVLWGNKGPDVGRYQNVPKRTQVLPGVRGTRSNNGSSSITRSDKNHRFGPTGSVRGFMSVWRTNRCFSSSEELLCTLYGSSAIQQGLNLLDNRGCNWRGGGTNPRDISDRHIDFRYNRMSSLLG